jgi:hypothetical protein
MYNSVDSFRNYPIPHPGTISIERLSGKERKLTKIPRKLN